MCERRAALEQGESFEKSMAAEIVEASSRPAERSASFFDAANRRKVNRLPRPIPLSKTTDQSLVLWLPEGVLSTVSRCRDGDRSNSMAVKDVDEVGGTIPVPIADWKAKQSRTNIRKVIRSIVMVPGTMRGTVSCNSLGRDEGRKQCRCRGDCTQQLLHGALPFNY